MQFLGAQLGQPVLAATHNRLRQALFALDHLVNHLFQRACGDEFMHLDVALLADAEGAIGGLIFNGWIPPAVEVENVVGARQIQATLYFS